MKPKLNTALSGLILLMIAGCSGGKYVQTIKEGETAYLSGNYSTSLENMERVINDREFKGKTADAYIYYMAGISAREIPQYDKTLTYLEKAQQLGYSDELMYVGLSEGYLHIDNLSKEITALETYMKKYPEGVYSAGMHARLFETCEESENYELADELWLLLDDSYKEKTNILEVYLSINQSRKNEALSDSLAQVILSIDSNNELALKRFAEKYYYKAENRYQEEMEAYEKKRTNSQYNKLLKAFKIVTSDFKTSLEYFEKLYKLNPDPEYATFLGNIYTRLDDEKTAKYYYDRSK